MVNCGLLSLLQYIIFTIYYFQIHNLLLSLSQYITFTMDNFHFHPRPPVHCKVHHWLQGLLDPPLDALDYRTICTHLTSYFYVYKSSISICTYLTFDINIVNINNNINISLLYHQYHIDNINITINTNINISLLYV